MQKKDRKIIYILLLSIIILSCILLYKINKDNNSYDKEIYDQIYSEFETWDNDEEIDQTISKNTMNVVEKASTKVAMTSENKYKIIATIRIPKLNLYYPIINETTEEYLRVALTKLYGSEPNQVGNFCIIGHNLENGKFLSDLEDLKIDDMVIIKGKDGSEEDYYVYDSYIVDADDLSCTSQNTNGKKEITLITCTNKKNTRLIVKCRA